ncbi:MAG: beta-ketoacyl-[acyl-carrier-protein] synthase family protein [Cyclobacteriaceae bacterium]|nr:beta-ketoacyl-[acyl-carrier-protein] synthase family protein [Cyclobacteriaceae bacterium]
MTERVYVTGWGIISALGNDIEENLHALKNKKSGISSPLFLKTNYANQKVVGEVKLSNNDLKKQLGFEVSKTISRTALLGMIAAKESIRLSGLSSNELHSALFFNGTSVGGMDVSEVHYKAFLEGEEVNYKEAFSGHDCGHSTETIANYIGALGETSTISTACSSSANTIMQACRTIKGGKAEVAIAGGTDALSVFTLNGFNSLKILDDHPCKPFDKNRKGLNLGEGAAYLVLESERSVRARGANVLGEVIGYGNANDAYHQTASSPQGEGALNAMRKAMSVADDISIDYINVHGTGTGNNDMSESMAVNSLFKENMPLYSSTKAYTGHTLGAAGAIEAVFSLLSLRHNLLFPCLRVDTPMDVISQPPIFDVVEKEVNTVMSNSLGFGGNCSALIFKK